MDMKQTLDQLKADLETFGEEALALKEDNIKKIDENCQITAHVRTLDKQIEDEKIKSRDLEESNTILKTEREETKQKQIEEKAIADQERDRLVAEIENLRGQCATLNEEKEAIHREKEEKEEEKENMLRENEELREQLREKERLEEEKEEEKQNILREKERLDGQVILLQEGNEALGNQVTALHGEVAGLKEEKTNLQKLYRGISKSARRKENLLTATNKRLKATEIVVQVGDLVMQHKEGQLDNFVKEMKQDLSGSVLAQAKSLAAKFDPKTEDKNTEDSRETSKRLFKELNKSTKEVQSMLKTTEKRGIKLEAKRMRLNDPTDFLRLDFGGAGEGEELGQNLDQQVELNQQGEDEMELEEVVVPAVIHHPDPLQGP